MLQIPAAFDTNQAGRTDFTETICLVDDDPSVRRSIARLLESDGFAVVAFAESQPFLDYLATNPVRLAILDIWLDRINGMELLANLCEKSPQTRVIFITGVEDRGAKTTVMQAGAYAFFVKPFNDLEFLCAVRGALLQPNLKKMTGVEAT